MSKRLFRADLTSTKGKSFSELEIPGIEPDKEKKDPESLVRRALVLYPGTFNDEPITAETLQELVDNFDVLAFQPPIQGDHWWSIHETVGYVTALEIEDGKLYAMLEIIDPVAKEKVQSGLWKYVSVGFTLNPATLMEISFVSQPAVRGEAGQGTETARLLSRSGDGVVVLGADTPAATAEDAADAPAATAEPAEAAPAAEPAPAEQPAAAEAEPANAEPPAEAAPTEADELTDGEIEQIASEIEAELNNEATADAEPAAEPAATLSVKLSMEKLARAQEELKELRAAKLELIKLKTANTVKELVSLGHITPAQADAEAAFAAKLPDELREEYFQLRRAVRQTYPNVVLSNNSDYISAESAKAADIALAMDCAGYEPSPHGWQKKK